MFYVNDGSEYLQDSVVFEIELTSTGGTLPPELRYRQRFRLQISIRPANDIPRIEVNKGRPLRIGKRVAELANLFCEKVSTSNFILAEGTTKLLDEHLVNVIDPDSTKADLVVTLVPAGGGSALPGHIVNERFPGQARNSFTLEDLAQDRVSFVHTVRSVGIMT